MAITPSESEAVSCPSYRALHNSTHLPVHGTQVWLLKSNLVAISSKLGLWSRFSALFDPTTAKFNRKIMPAIT